MIKEFTVNLSSNILDIILIFVEKEKYEIDKKVKIVGCWCFGDLINFFPKGDLAFEKNVNYKIVPKKDKVRLYMRYLSLRPIYDTLNPKKGYIFTYFIFQGKLFMARPFV
jgi:hypothetical protein